MSETALQSLENELNDARLMDHTFDDKCAYHAKLMVHHYKDLIPMKLDETEEGRKINQAICAKISAAMIEKFGDI